MYDNEKVLKASDQRDIIWSLFEETLAKVLRACKKNFFFTGAIMFYRAQLFEG